MASERVTLEAAGGGLNPRDQQRLDELRKANAQGHPQGVRQDPGAPVNWVEIEGVGVVPGSGGGAGQYPQFNFDWEKARSDAFAQLTPYYTQKLKEAGFDIERAKRLIEEDYKMGLRDIQTDASREARYREEDLATQLKTIGLDFADEDRNLRGDLNRRGVLVGEMERGQASPVAPVSDYAQTYHFGPQKERQDLRRLAVERAIKRQGDVADIDLERNKEKLSVNRTRGIEEQDIAYPRVQRDLQEEQREKAFTQLTPMKYEEEYSKYKAANRLG